jgi:hypothetical protein
MISVGSEEALGNEGAGRTDERHRVKRLFYNGRIARLFLFTFGGYP